MLFENIKLIKQFFSASSAQTIATILDVPVTKVYDWQDGREFPTEDQTIKIKEINSPLNRIKRAFAGKIVLILKNTLIFVSAYELHPFWSNRSVLTRSLINFKNKPRFLESYAKGMQVIGYEDPSYFRIHQLIWAASVALDIDGDWVELGTGKGMSMSSVLKYHQEPWNKGSKKLWLVDTFSPYQVDPRTGIQNKSKITHKWYCDDIGKVKEHFKEFNNVQFLQGLVPGCLDQLKVDKISFLHIDLNSAQPEVEAFSFLWDRLVKGAIVVLDDYGGASRKDQHNAMNNFALTHSFEILCMTGGQGLIIK